MHEGDAVGALPLRKAPCAKVREEIVSAMRRSVLVAQGQAVGCQN